MEGVTLTEEIRELAKEQGFSAVAFASADPLTEARDAALSRTRQGLMDGLTWWSERRAEVSADPRRMMPDARSLIALAFPHPRPDPTETPEGGPRGRIAAYALGRDYHEVLEERMRPLVEMLRSRGYEAKTFVDHGWMLDRAAAARAGLGWLGKNTMLLLPGAGSYFFLAEIVTTAALDQDEPSKKSCGQCDACLRACPTGALVKPGVLDNRRCISFWTIEHRGVIPVEIRPLLGDWVFGCDICQEVCPVNVRPAVESDVIAAYGDRIEHRPLLEELLSLDEEGFRARYRQSPLWRTRRSGLLRNACIALGNLGDPTSVPALSAALQDDDPLIRGHAAWALGRIGGAAALERLGAALRTEPNAWVRRECEAALAACGGARSRAESSPSPQPAPA
jgi:epoxyqueuosine reductase